MANREEPRERFTSHQFAERRIHGASARGREPVGVRNATCTGEETDDEIFWLLMFYNDCLAAATGDSLDRVLVVGKGIDGKRVRAISAEVLGREPNVLRPEDVGPNLPVGSMGFDEPAGHTGRHRDAWRSENWRYRILAEKPRTSES
ncbi:MAG: hypothetical protein IPJ30_13725 [Acidobacteria bacterium]|nr:hypothetical protein [Acidobacteriota bacterium]